LLLIFTTYVELDTGEEGEIRAECHLIVNTQSSFVRRKGGSLPALRFDYQNAKSSSSLCWT
jgi:hypothetical protein